MPGNAVVVYDEAMLAHEPARWNPPEEPEPGDAPGGGDWSHPERPERLSTIRALLDEQPVPGLTWRSAGPVSRAALERVHRPYYLDYVETLRGRTEMIDPDTTAVSPGTVDAASVAAGAAVAAVDAVFAPGGRRAMALVRPPGHHATPARAMGFCFYNNAAVAAAHARAAHGCERVLLIDWDVHHGNGTQEIFYGTRDVLFFDTHCEAPFYPGTGALVEIGRDGGIGATVNVPLPGGCDDATMLAAFEDILEPFADLFQPSLVLVSAGFDAHELDQTMVMTTEGFGALCAVARRIAERHAGGKLVLCMEGGYNAGSIASSARACLEILVGAEAPPIDRGAGNGVGLGHIAAAREFHGLTGVTAPRV
jgi:acetoin utilization deacetylase AcuC-like enzyme